MADPSQPDSPLRLAKAAAAQALSPDARRLHHAILRHFADTGRPPSAANLAARLGLPADAPHELETADLVLLDQFGEIRAAYPFSPTPTAHQLHIAGGPTVFAMCAIDALGMSAMLDRPVTVTSREPDTAEPITVSIGIGIDIGVGAERQQATWLPDTTVVYAVTTDRCATSADATCGHINFFTTPAGAHAWARRHPEVTGTLLDQPEAIATAIAEFGAFLQSR